MSLFVRVILWCLTMVICGPIAVEIAYWLAMDVGTLSLPMVLVIVGAGYGVLNWALVTTGYERWRHAHDSGS